MIRMIKIRALTPRDAAPWRSVCIFVPVTRKDGMRPTWLDKDVMRDALRQVAKRHGVPLKQIRIVHQTAVTSGCYGYIRVYRGSGTIEEKRRFKRVLNAASKLEIAPPDPSRIPFCAFGPIR